MNELVSIAIETSCRQGGIALGLGDRLVSRIDFDASSRHATQLIVRLRELLAGQQLRAADVNEVYISSGPGSFTGVRVGITVARTLAQAVPGLRCVQVPTTHAVAQNVVDLPWQNLAVVLDAKESLVYAQLFTRSQPAEPVAAGEAHAVPAGEPVVMPFQKLVSIAPKPLLLMGEGMLYQKYEVAALPPQVTLAEASTYYPNAQGVWRVGRSLARAGEYTEYHHLLPIYARRSEAERLWDLRHPQVGDGSSQTV